MGRVQVNALGNTSENAWNAGKVKWKGKTEPARAGYKLNSTADGLQFSKS
jgi:hypothetical protein